jgi:putative two-component system response regulator
MAKGVYSEAMEGWKSDLLLESSQLHDVGKISITDTVLKKPAKLSPEEFDGIKAHVNFGVSLIERIEKEMPDADFLKYAKIFAETHHEKWDGSGYPSGLSGEDIPLPGRLLAIADVYDALTSDRPYKKAFSHDSASRIILAGKGTHFDPILVEVFEELSDQFAASAYSTLHPPNETEASS